MKLWKHSNSLQTGSGFFGSSMSKNAFPRFNKFRALSKLGKCPFAEEKLSPSNRGKSLCKSETTSSWQPTDVSTKTGPSRPGLRKDSGDPFKKAETGI